MGKAVETIHVEAPATWRMRPIYLVISVLVITYVATTGIGASLFPFQFGRDQLVAFSYPQQVPLDWMTSLGSPLYWSLLFSMVVIAPLAAFLAEHFARQMISMQRRPDIAVWIPIAVAAAMAAFCIYKLAMAEALSAHELWDRSICSHEKLLRRIELYGLLGNRYYAFAYSSLPIVGCYLLAQGITQRNAPALIGWATVSAMTLWFDVAMMTKAPAVIYVGTVGLTLALCGFGALRSALLALPLAIVVYAGLSLLLNCTGETAPWERTLPSGTTAAEFSSTVASPQTPASPRSATVPDRTSSQDPSLSTPTGPSRPLIDTAFIALRTVLFRMAAGFPYYVQIFSEPDQRCGIEHPPLRWLPPRTCFGPTKVYSKMRPLVTYATGFQPGPVNVSAYGEAGLWYVIAATAACGLILGILVSFAGGRDPLSIAIIVACCIYAYYATQVSLTGSLIDSYGLIWLILPLILMVAISAVSHARIRSRT